MDQKVSFKYVSIPFLLDNNMQRVHVLKTIY